MRRFEETFTAQVTERPAPGVCERLDANAPGTDDAPAAAEAAPGPLGLETLLGGTDGLKTVQAPGIPDEPFREVSEKIMAACAQGPGSRNRNGGSGAGRSERIRPAVVGRCGSTG